MANDVDTHVDDDLYLMVAGSRSYKDSYYNTLCKNLDSFVRSYQAKYPNGSVHIVEGTAKGVDDMAGRYAKQRGYDLIEMPAKWNDLEGVPDHLIRTNRDGYKYNVAAGMERNRKMVELVSSHKNGTIICFWDGKSPGTKDNFKLAKEFGTQIHVFDSSTGKWKSNDDVYALTGAKPKRDFDEVVVDLGDSNLANDQRGLGE